MFWGPHRFFSMAKPSIATRTAFPILLSCVAGAMTLQPFCMPLTSELDGRDLRRGPIEVRKTALAKLLRKADYGIFFTEHVEDEAEVVFRHACKLRLEGIVWKRRGSPYVSGRSSYWLKLKNPNSAAAMREAKEEGG
jgi:ATP dependent DNA ligase domain